VSRLAAPARPVLLRSELVLVCLLAWLALVSIPLRLQGLGLSWDALNHHFYLGWISESQRFDRDFRPALFQTYQFPYLYWPLYKMAVSGWSGMWTGVVLATLHTLVVPPIWMMARTCMPGQSVFDIAMRVMAVVLALTTGVALSQFGSTSNDLMAAVPLVWAMALALAPLDDQRMTWLTPGKCALLSGFMAGVAVAFKLSNGPLALVVMPLLWLFATPGGPVARLVQAAKGGVATLLGCAVVYGYWGFQLWALYGNPIYPFHDRMFDSVRAWAGWVP
jgi:hypothetical protein